MMNCKIQFRFLIGLIVFMLSGCVTPVVEKYTAFQDQHFDSRNQPAELFEGETTELMQQGYLLIGYVDFKHNVQACYNNNSCANISENNLTDDELLRRSARRGADRVQVLNTKLELVPKVLSYCTSYMTTGYTDKDGNYHSMVTCAGYASYSGFLESWNKRALLWRHEPELASADNNFHAVEKALAIIARDKPQADSPTTSVAQLQPQPETEFSSAEAPIEDLYAQQLMAAIHNANYEFLGTQLNTDKLTTWQTENEFNLLMLALRMQKPEVSLWLMDQPVTWNHKTKSGYSTLEYAIALATPADVERLLEKHNYLQASLADKDKIYQALAEAVSPDMLEYLEKKGFSLNGKAEKFSLLYLAILNDNAAMANHLLERNAKIDSKDPTTPAALTAAVVRNNTEMVNTLLGKGAKTTAADDYGNTAMHYAALFASPDVVKQLQAHGGQFNQFNNKHFSPIYLALLNGQWETAEYLMQQDLDYTIPDAEAFVQSLAMLLHRAPKSTLDSFLQKTELIYVKQIENLMKELLIACAETCTQEKMTSFLENGVNVYYAPDGQSLFRRAYDKKNIGVMVALIKHGFQGESAGGQLSPLQKALIAGDATLVEAYRLAEAP